MSLLWDSHGDKPYSLSSAMHLVWGDRLENVLLSKAMSPPGRTVCPG